MSPNDKKIIENIVICSWVWETKSCKVLGNFGSQSSLFPRYCSIIPEEENSEFRYTYNTPRLNPTPSVIR